MHNLSCSTELLWESLYTNPHIYLWMKDLNNVLTDLNPAAARLEGRPTAELRGKSCKSIYAEEIAESHQRADQQVIATGQELITESKWPGNIHGVNSPWLKLIRSPIRDTTGLITGILIFGTEISQEKGEDDHHSRQGEQIRGMMDIATFPVMISSLNKNKLLYVNRSMTELFEVPFEVALMENPQDYYIDAGIREEIKKEILNHRMVRNKEVRYKLRSGKIIYCLVSAASVAYNDEQCAFVTFYDISEIKHKEVKLQQTAEEFRLVFENSTDALFWADTHSGIIINCNRKAEELLKLERVDIIGKMHWEIHPKKDIEKYQKYFHEIKTTTRGPMELEVENSEGLVIPVGISIATIQAGDQFITQASVSDISERYHFEKLLRESEIKYRLMAENMKDVIWQMSKDLRFTYVSPSYYHLAGYQPSEIIGHEIFEFVTEETRLVLQKMLQSREVREQVNIQPEIQTFEAAQHKKNGEIIWTEIVVNPILDELGNLTFYQGVTRDITKRKSAELALAESERRISLLFHEMSEGIALHELVFENGQPVNYLIREINPAFARHLGIDYEQILNKLVTEVLRLEMPPLFSEFTEIALEGGRKSFEFFNEVLQKYFHISVVSPMKNQFATVVEDITDRKWRERELQDKNAELERFTYTVSHDLKSPLVTIKGFIGMLEEDIRHQEVEHIQEDIARITSAADKMTCLLNDLLALSRVGRVISIPEMVPMRQIIAEALELTAVQLKDRQMKVTLQPDFPEVLVDYQRIREVWQNLIENAAKFSGKQTAPALEIGWKGNGNYFIFWIKDNGMGIEKQYFNNIFGLFNKLENKSEGTGIGLALVKRIIEVHGGEVWVESLGINQGATFFFSLPVKLAN